MRKPRSIHKKLLIGLAFLPVWLALVEGGHRAWLRLAGRPYDSSATRDAILLAGSRMVETVAVPGREREKMDELTANSLASLHAHPFAGVEQQGGLQMLQGDFGRFEGQRDPGELFVMVLGGSVAHQFFPDGAEALAARLRADPRCAGLRVVVRDYARAGYKQPQQLTSAAWLLSLGLAPDVVLNLDGYNETALYTYNAVRGAHPLYPFLTQWAHVAKDAARDPASLDRMLAVREAQRSGWASARRALDLRLHWSSVLGTLALRRLDAGLARVARAQEAYVQALAPKGSIDPVLGPTYPRDAQGLTRMMVRNWRESSRSLRALCEARSIVYVHALQPTLHDAGSKRLTEKEVAAGRLDPVLVRAVREGYPLLREAGAALRAEGLEFVDASTAFAGVEEALYHDFCHFGRRGNEILAEVLGAGILEALGRRGAAAGGGR